MKSKMKPTYRWSTKFVEDVVGTAVRLGKAVTLKQLVYKIVRIGNRKNWQQSNFKNFMTSEVLAKFQA